MRKQAFRKMLHEAAPNWIDQNIITTDQRDAILELYTRERENRGKKRLAIIVIAMASILLATGIILFYAANWRRMPPVAKVIQVILLILGTYAFGDVFRRRDPKYKPLSQAFTSLGMVSFGAALMLTAQMFHISARPTLLLLIWSVGVIAMTVITTDRVGVYLALLLSFIWDIWTIDIGVGYINAGYLLFLSLLAFLSFRWKMKTALMIILILFVYWLEKSGIILLISSDLDWGMEKIGILQFILLQMPFSLAMFSIIRRGRQISVLSRASTIGIILAWILTTVPLFGISWPIAYEYSVSFLADFGIEGAFWMPITYLALVVIAVVGTFLFRDTKEDRLFILIFAGISVVAFFLPMTNKTTLMIVTHVAILAFIFLGLYTPHGSKNRWATDRITALVLVLTIIIAKAIGFLTFGGTRGHFFVAFGLAFVIFATACHFINIIVSRMLIDRGRGKYPMQLITGIIVSAVFLAFYVLSFEKPDQKSIFDASESVKALIFVFLGITVGLGVALYTISTDKLFAVISGGIFLISSAILLIAGPGVSWVFYSVAFNLILLLIIGTMLFFSSRTGSRALANFGFGLFLLLITTRYFDLLWDMMAGSALFIATGTLAMLIGFLMLKGRRRLIRRIIHDE